MKLQHRQIRRLQRLALTIGVSFLIGAVVGGALSWRVLRGETTTTVRAAIEPPPDPEPAHDPAEPRAVERPGERGEAIPATMTGSVANADAVQTLRDRDLKLPVQGVRREALRDTFSDARGGSAHEALDIMASEKLVTQYNAYTPFPDVHVNGKLTLSENIADVAGLSAAYDAYRALGNATPESDRVFFLSFAQAYKSKLREQLARQLVLTDGHALDEYRADTVRNLDAWYPAFDVKAGQKLYLDPSDRVRVW